MVEPLPEVGPAEAVELLDSGDAIALDVREPEEWEAGHIAGSVHIPIGELVMRQDEIPDDLPLVAVCRTGSRSAYATELLVRAGYDAQNLTGGLKAWELAGLALEPAGGFVA